MSTRAACASSRWGLLLLLLLLATCLRFGGAEDEALPLSLVDLVMNSPISSMQDLQRLLDVDSVEEEEEEVHSNGTHKRLPRSLAGVQVAQQAMCKVRTEVMEVTRAMLDRRNANFLLWPLCVEVQRCSGCCNTRTLQCVPVAVKTRHLQMTKIQFINRQPVYEKVIIPVEDHVSCSCQSHASAHVPQAKATPPPPPPRLPPKSVPPKTQLKEELHRHDDLKQNQRFHLDDPETQEAQWQSKYTLSHKQGAPAHTLTHTQGYRPSPVQHTLTHTPAGPSYVSVEDVITRKTTLGVPHLLSDTTQHFTHQEEVKDPHTQQDGVKDHHTLPEELPEHRIHLGSGDDQVKVQHQPTEHHRHHHHHHHQLHDKATSPQPRHKPIHDSSQSEVTLHHSSQLEAPILSYSHVEVIGQSSGQTELPDHHSGQSATPSFHRSQSETPNQRHHHSQSDHSEHHLDGMEREIYHHHQHHIPHLHVTQATTLHQSSTAKAVMDAPPATVPVPQTPPPTVLQRRRRRKHRRRMSKSAMRAMIMVMS